MARYSRFFSALAFIALVSYCIIGAIIVNSHSIGLMDNPIDNSLPEGANVYTALRVGATGQLYISYSQRPHVEQPFGPLFYAAMGSIARVSHLNLDLTVRRIRWLMYGCYLACAVLVFVICRKLGSPVGLSALAGVMMLAQPDFLGWNITVRPDLLMLLLMLLSLLCAMKINEHRWFFAVLAGALAGFAFLIKQPGAAVGVAIGLVLLWRKEFRKLVLFGISAAVPIVVMFSILVLRNERFWEQFTSIGKAYWSLGGGLRFLWLLSLEPLYIAPVCVAVAGLLVCFKVGEAWQFPASFLVVTGVTGILGLPQIGSNTNYLLPGLTGCCLLLPAAIKLFQSRPKLQILALILAPALVWAAHSGGEYAEIYSQFTGGVPDNVSFAKLHPLRLLTDIPMLTLRGRDPEFLDGFSTHSLELTGHWSSAPIVEEIREQQFDVVILRRLIPRAVFKPRPMGYREVASWRGVSEFSPEVVSALNENYKVYCSAFTSVVLQPNDRSVQIPPDYFSPLLGGECKTGAQNYPPRLVVAADSR